MLAYIIRKLIQAVVITFIISMVTFTLLFVAQDPAMALSSPEASATEIERLRSNLGLDQPVPVQYGIWLGTVLRGDFGNSLFSRRPVTAIIRPRLRASAELAGWALLITIILGIPLGIIAAINRGSIIDTIATGIAVSGQAMPIFWLGLILILFFSVRLGMLPSSGYGTWRHIILPAAALGYSVLPLTMRLTRSAMLDVLQRDYIRTAHAKGLRQRVVYLKHALKNSMTPIMLSLGLQFGTLLGGAVVTETVFGWPGIGQLAVISVTTSDIPVVQVIVLFSTTAVILSNLFADILVGFADPRVRY